MHVSPRYREAYPRLPVTQLHRSARTGAGQVIWRNRDQVAIGSAAVTDLQSQSMTVSFQVHDDGPVEAFRGTLFIELVFKSAGGLREDALAVCPACRAHVKFLLAKAHRWECADCQELVNRSSLLRTNTRLTEKVDTLRRRFGAGRPKGMHQYTFEAGSAKLQQLEKKLGDWRLDADTKYLYIVECSAATAKLRHDTSIIPRYKKDAGTRLFAQPMLDFLNDIFVAKAEAAYTAFVQQKEDGSRKALAETIEAAAVLRPLRLGAASLCSKVTGTDGIARLAMEVPFSGDECLLHVLPLKASPLPALYAEVDTTRQVLCLSQPESSGLTVTSEILLNEQIHILTKYLREQVAVLNEYHKKLKLNVRRFIRYKG